jgi:hypothetical protein
MIRFSTFANIRDNRPKMNALPSWEAFADYLEDQSNIEGTAKDKTLCICPATYPDGVVRAKSAVEGWQWFAADIDNKPVNEAHSTIEAVAEIMFAQNCPFVIYTTSSHTMEAHRFRLMFPMDRLVKPDEFADVWKSMAQWLGCLDAPTKDESRLFVAPRAWPGSFFFRHDGGEPVCVDMITLTNPVIVAPVASRKLTSAFLDTTGMKPVEFGDASLHGPFVTPTILGKSSSGDGRMFRFMTAVGTRALLKGYAITADDLVSIGLEFASSIGRSADANRDIGRDAENAHRAAVSHYAEVRANQLAQQCPAMANIDKWRVKRVAK